MENNHHNDDMARKNALTGLIVLGAVIFMVGLSFAAVPLYGAFCRVTGFGGTTQVADALPGIVLEREVIVKFDAQTDSNLMWDFRPEQREVSVRLGQRGVASYRAVNRASQPTGGTALFNVTPLKVGKYFHKIQCFCFSEQILGANEDVSMPVVFYVDPAMNDDPSMEDVKTITLSYTFYPADSKTLDDALEAFYNETELTVEQIQ